MTTFKEGLIGEQEAARAHTSPKRTVIKNAAAKFSKTRVIQAETFKQSSDEPTVTPMIENGEVVGIAVACSCGEQVKVYFEYED